MRKKVRVAAHHSQPHNAYSPDAAFYQARGLRDLERALKAPRFEGRAKNVIFFVGDGLGVATHTMSRISRGRRKAQAGRRRVSSGRTGTTVGSSRYVYSSQTKSQFHIYLLLSPLRDIYHYHQHQMSPTVYPRGKGSSDSTT